MGLHIHKTMLETPPMDDSPTFIPWDTCMGEAPAWPFW